MSAPVATPEQLAALMVLAASASPEAVAEAEACPRCGGSVEVDPVSDYGEVSRVHRGLVACQQDGNDDNCDWAMTDAELVAAMANAPARPLTWAEASVLAASTLAAASNRMGTPPAWRTLPLFSPRRTPASEVVIDVGEDGKLLIRDTIDEAEEVDGPISPAEMDDFELAEAAEAGVYIPGLLDELRRRAALLTDDELLSFEPFEGDDGDVRVLWTRVVRGRREHRDHWSGMPIPKGELHVVRGEVCDGEFLTTRHSRETLWMALAGGFGSQELAKQVAA